MGETTREALTAEESYDWYAPVRVEVLDTKTAERAYSEDWCAYSLMNGNGSCDCNRYLMFDYDDEALNDALDDGQCLGAHRCLVMSVEPMPPGATADSFNERYPLDIRMRFSDRSRSVK